MHCMLHKLKFVFVNAPRIWLYLFLDGIFFSPRMFFPLKCTGQRGKGLETEHSGILHQLSRTSAGTVALAAAVTVQPDLCNKWKL